MAGKQRLDGALTSTAQTVELYEIAQYSTLVAWARELGRDDCASALAEMLSKEKATDAKLTQLADSRVDRKAA